MGVCYSEEQEWQAYKQTRRGRHRKQRRQKTSSIIYQEKSCYESSFASNAYASFRQDLHQTLSSLAGEGNQLFMGSLVEMKEQELEVLCKSLHKINCDGEPHNLSDPLLLCNMKTKNYLHTHKIKLPECKTVNEVSCCPYTSNHIPEYDIWKLILAQSSQVNQPEMPSQEQKQPSSEEIPAHSQNGNETIFAYIYHPFTQRFLGWQKGSIVGSQQKTIWKVESFGPRRNGGFMKMSLPEGELCMSEQKGLLEKHRKIQLCKQKHISHLWELMFVDPEEI